MNTISPTLYLNVNVTDAGKHAAAWRLQDDPKSFIDAQFYENIAREAESAGFDALFIGDLLHLPESSPTKPWQALDPVVEAATMLRVTERIGVIATASTSFNHPFSLARQMASLDLIGNGRFGWNAVTTMSEEVAGNFGLRRLPPPEERYDRATEFLEIVTSFWDSWHDEALIVDQKRGIFTQPQSVKRVSYIGEHLSVDGYFPVPRTPQGRPVLVQAGSSTAGQELAARFADVVFTAQRDRQSAIAFRQSLSDLAVRNGRRRDSVKVMAGVFPLVAETESEAREHWEQLNALTKIDTELSRIAKQLGVPAASMELDSPLNVSELLSQSENAESQGFLHSIIAAASEGNLTLRELIHLNVGGHRLVIGTPESIADDFDLWRSSGAVDGFNVNFDILPDGLHRFSDLVIPLLEERGIFSRRYQEPTLAGRYGTDLAGASTATRHK